nr:hypothetical protein CFP56_73756 [Quercus suber]
MLLEAFEEEQLYTSGMGHRAEAGTSEVTAGYGQSDATGFFCPRYVATCVDSSYKVPYAMNGVLHSISQQQTTASPIGFSPRTDDCSASIKGQMTGVRPSGH